MGKKCAQHVGISMDKSVVVYPHYPHFSPTLIRMLHASCAKLRIFLQQARQFTTELYTVFLPNSPLLFCYYYPYSTLPTTTTTIYNK